MRPVDKILKLASEKGVKQSYLNDLIGGYRGKITEWKNGKSSPTYEEIKTISDFFGVSSEYILEDIEDGMITHEEAFTVAEIVGDFAKMNQYSANHISGSAFVQGANSGTLIVKNGGDSRALSEPEIELLRIYNMIDPKQRHKLLGIAYEMEEEKIANNK